MSEFGPSNMNYFYYEKYFDGLSLNLSDNKLKVDLPGIDKKNNIITEHRFSADKVWKDEFSNVSGYSEIQATTLYPGLLIGTGTPHNLKGVEGAIYNGFSLDPVSGMPFIPGSSLKGMFRGCFPDIENHVKYSVQRKEYIKKILADKCLINFDDIDALRMNIFENNDVFLGAFPGINGKQKAFPLLDVDNITPHTPDWYSNYDVLKRYKNPVPVTILKVRPGVQLIFSFILHDMTDEDGNVLVSAENKRVLFENLLRDFGIGAKTDVGFGRLNIPETKPETIVKIQSLDRGNFAHFDLAGKDCRISKTDQLIYFHKKGIAKNPTLRPGDRVKVQFKENHVGHNGTYPLYEIVEVIKNE